ncbi:MAG: SdpI family protein [Tissierellaceae bacterium]|jgi:uncharacterized membrane protein|nr:SdpI family protein [Tissierellia bacterium]
MFKKKINIYSLILIVLVLTMTIIFYDKLPEEIPIHWNLKGEVDNYVSKPFGAFLSPLLMVAIWLGMKFLPNIDPRRHNYKKFESSYEIAIGVLVTFAFVLQMAIILSSLGYDISMDRIIMVMAGVMFVVIGNYLPKAKSNFFYGIKTPWTLSSEISWKKTHRLGGRLFVVSGLAIILSSLLFNETVRVVVMILTLLAVAIVPIWASYFYAKED